MKSPQHTAFLLRLVCSSLKHFSLKVATPNHCRCRFPNRMYHLLSNTMHVLVEFRLELHNQVPKRLRLVCSLLFKLPTSDFSVEILSVVAFVLRTSSFAALDPAVRSAL